MNKRILITGASGFVGQNLISIFKDSYDISLLSSQRKENSIYPCYDWEHLDLIPFDEFDAIVHLAGKAHDVKGLSAADEYFKINTDLTKQIYDKFLASKSKSFIFLSSVKAVADVVSSVLTEDVLPAPVGAYGISKQKAEEYILSQANADKNVYIFRPCMIHGPGNKGNLNLLHGVVKKGIPYPLGAFDNKRSFISIDNLTFIIDHVISKPVASGIYNLADDESLSTNELIALICRALGRKPKIWKFPKSLIVAMAKLGDVLHLPLNTFRLNKLVENYVVSNDKIKTAIGIKVLPTSSSEGIIRTIKSFK